MAEYIAVARQQKRMCESYDECEDCPLSFSNNIARQTCDEFMREHPDIAEAIIMYWATEHSGTTLEEVFFARNPAALKTSWGTPSMCPHHMGLADMPDECTSSEWDCVKCWSRPFVEKQSPTSSTSDSSLPGE